LPKNYDLVNQYIHQFISSAQDLKGFNLLFLLFVVVFLFREIDLRIGYIFSRKKQRHLGFDLLVYLLVLVLTPLLLASSLLLSSYLGASKMLAYIPMGGIFIASLPIVLSAIGLSLLYYFIAGGNTSFKSAFKAGFIVAFFLEILKSIILIYITFFPTYELIYGALSAVLLFMLWVHFSWILVLFGASLAVVFNSKEDKSTEIDLKNNHNQASEFVENTPLN
jgi:membrane protein